MNIKEINIPNNYSKETIQLYISDKEEIILHSLSKYANHFYIVTKRHYQSLVDIGELYEDFYSFYVIHHDSIDNKTYVNIGCRGLNIEFFIRYIFERFADIEELKILK